MTEPADIHALAARLERLETGEAARAALYRYAEGADTRDWALLGSAFADDAVLEMPGTQVRGRDAIVSSLRDMLPDPFITRHLLVNPQVTVDGPGRATVRATVYYLHEGSGYEATGWGDYRDEVSVVDGVGVITRKVFTPAQHLPGSLAGVAERLEMLETAERAREASWRYATAVDTADLELLAQVFTEDAVLTTRKGPRQGRDEIVAYYATALADPVAASTSSSTRRSPGSSRASPTWRATSSTPTRATTRRCSAGARTSTGSASSTASATSRRSGSRSTSMPTAAAAGRPHDATSWRASGCSSPGPPRAWAARSPSSAPGRAPRP